MMFGNNRFWASVGLIRGNDSRLGANVRVVVWLLLLCWYGVGDITCGSLGATSAIVAAVRSVEVTTADILQIVYGEPGKAGRMVTSLYEPRQQVTRKICNLYRNIESNLLA